MDLNMSEERRLVSKKVPSSPKKDEYVEVAGESTLDARRAQEKKNYEPWYFTHS
jgi:hypothetical protein